MDQIIAFTPHDLTALILEISTAIVTVSAAIGVIVRWVSAARKPDKLRDEKIERMSKVIDSMGDEIDDIKARQDEIEGMNNDLKKDIGALNHGVYALLSHALNGNNITELKTATKQMRARIFDE